MGYFSELQIETSGYSLLSRAEQLELSDPHNEYGLIDFNVEDAPQENQFDAELDKEELEALELHAERWDLERGGYL